MIVEHFFGIKIQQNDFVLTSLAFEGSRLDVSNWFRFTRSRYISTVKHKADAQYVRRLKLLLVMLRLY